MKKIATTITKHHEWARRRVPGLTIGDFREKVCQEIGKLVVSEEFPHGRFTKAAASGEGVGRIEGLHDYPRAGSVLNGFVLNAALDILALREGCVVYPDNPGEGYCVFRARQKYDFE